MGAAGNGERTYQLKKPPGHKPPIPRWSLEFPSLVNTAFTLYIGLQDRSGNRELVGQAENAIESILQKTTPPIDRFRVTHGFDIAGSTVWVAYWISKQDYETTRRTLNLSKLWSDLGNGRDDIGIWSEAFAAPLERLETNYARLDHKPGLAQLPGTSQPAHEITGYWGAGRDRVPAAAHDLFPPPEDISRPSDVPKGYGERLTGTNYDHMCHIRSGQWWEKCGDEERLAYEHDLQVNLMKGMDYLWDHPDETGTLGLRFLQNLDENRELMKETCGAGFFRNWAELEQWSSRHPSHLAIYNGMMKHAKRFADDRKFMTWHEVWIFKAGEVRFEYINCDPTTGVIKHVPLAKESLHVG